MRLCRWSMTNLDAEATLEAVGQVDIGTLGRRGKAFLIVAVVWGDGGRSAGRVRSAGRSRARRRGALDAGGGGSVGHDADGTAGIVVGVEGELVGGHGVAGHGVHEVRELGLLTVGGGSAARGGVVVVLRRLVERRGKVVDTSGALGRADGRGRGDGRSGGRTAGRAGRARGGRSGGRGNTVVEDVEGQLAAGLDDSLHVGVVRLKVAIEDELRGCVSGMSTFWIRYRDGLSYLSPNRHEHIRSRSNAKEPW